MSLDTQLTNIISLAGGVTGIILALIGIGSWIRKAITKGISDTETRLCKDIKILESKIDDVKDIAEEARDDSKETLEKLNEHLISASQVLVEFEHLRDTVSRHEAVLERLQLKRSPV